MPAAGFRKCTYGGPRPWENTDVASHSDVEGCSRGELRLVAEALLAQDLVPVEVIERAKHILKVMANG